MEMAATSQQRPGNSLTTNIPEHSKANSRDFLRHRLHQIDKKIAKTRQNINRREN